MASRHAHAPWRKAMLVPFWCIQLFFNLVMIALLCLAVGVLVSWQNNEEYNDSFDGYTNEAALSRASHVIVPIWIAVAVLSLVLTITEIILLARHKLNPLAFLIMNVIKTAIWTVLFALDIISAVNAGGRTASVIGILIEAILVLSYWIPLIYGAVIYHRYRKEKKSYKPVDHPLSNPNETVYPSQYNQFVTPSVQSNVPSGPEGLGRRPSYNHQRDTRFDTYRQTGSFSDIGTMERTTGSPPLGSPPLNAKNSIPEVYVQHHDEDVFEMESSRRDLR